MTDHFQRYSLQLFLERFIDNAGEAPLFRLLKGLPSPATSGPWIAGGAIRRTLLDEPLSSDIDYFFREEGQLQTFTADLENRGGLQTSETEHAITFSVNVDGDNIVVQAIRIGYYPSLEAVLDSFDFTITQFGYDGTDLVCGQYSLWDLARKRLALHKLTYGVSTVRRLIKYTKQGFTACGGVLASILEATVSDPQTIQRSVTYVD